MNKTEVVVNNHFWQLDLFFVLFQEGQAQLRAENSFGQHQMSFWHTFHLFLSHSSCLVGWRYLIDLFCSCPVVLKPYPNSECLLTLCSYFCDVLGTWTPCGPFDVTGTGGVINRKHQYTISLRLSVFCTFAWFTENNTERGKISTRQQSTAKKIHPYWMILHLMIEVQCYWVKQSDLYAVRWEISVNKNVAVLILIYAYS